MLDFLHCETYLGFMSNQRNPRRAVRRSRVGRRVGRQKAGNASLAVAVLRTSTEDQNLGPEAQRASIERWAASNGVSVVTWHEDRLSGATPAEQRPGLMAALAALRAHGAGLLVAAKRDRIARDVVVAATVEQLARDAGARVVTADGVTVEDTPEGRLMRTLMDAFAEYERALIRARTKAALAVKRTRQERVSGRAPVGFRFEENRWFPTPPKGLCWPESGRFARRAFLWLESRLC